jgi:hypothetical protein
VSVNIQHLLLRVMLALVLKANKMLGPCSDSSIHATLGLSYSYHRAERLTETSLYSGPLPIIHRWG